MTYQCVLVLLLWLRVKDLMSHIYYAGVWQYSIGVGRVGVLMC